ncbi:GNAT family N-acetyltransferase [Aquimarina rhabdastrellae]
MNYSIAPLSHKNIKDLLYLYEFVFGNTYSLDFILKKFDTSYLGKSYYGHLAYHDKRPIAFHGAIPVLMEYQGRHEIAAQYGDAMTLPTYTGKGLFTKLGQLTDQQLQDDGISFVWGFPNQNSEYGYINKLHWNYVERMQGYKIKTAIIPLEKMVRKFKFTNQFYINRIKKAFEKYRVPSYIQGSVLNSKNDIVTTCRNTHYYTYKSFSENFTIKIDDVLFWIKIKNGLLIGDIETPSKAAFNNALEKLKKLASDNGIGELIFQSSPNTLTTDLLQEQSDDYFESWIVGFKNFSSKFPLEKLKLTFGDLDTF